MVRVGSEVKFKTEASYDERPFLITRMVTCTDSVMADGIYYDGCTLMDVEIKSDGEWLVEETGKEYMNIIEAIAEMGDER